MLKGYFTDEGYRGYVNGKYLLCQKGKKNYYIVEAK